MENINELNTESWVLNSESGVEIPQFAIHNLHSIVKILVVEDSPVEAELLRRILFRANYQVRLAKNGEEGLIFAREDRPALVMSDIQMPLMNGYELCREIKRDEALCNIPVILVSALSEPEDILEAVNVGADSYITKPYVESNLLERVSSLLATPIRQRRVEEPLEVEYGGKRHTITAGSQQMLNLLLSVYENSLIQNRDLLLIQNQLHLLNESLDLKVRERTAELHQVLEETITAIALTLEKRDPYTAGHQRRVAELAVAIGRKMNLSKNVLDGINFSGLIHDIGKIYVPAEFLTKPGHLLEMEFNLIKIHTEFGYEIMKGIHFPWPVADAVHQHHERMNGSGYPQGLKGDEIIIEARILCVADVVEAMAASRPYRTGRGIDSALEEIEKNRDILYDPVVVDACLSLFRNKEFAFNIPTFEHAQPDSAG
ncbi:MAG: HD domain-containing phosphohydrolase [Gallionella sp.]|jgi:response regulator RpfG family c-di-GMP phosphodiesterase